jgi:hypothetical protein
MTKLAEGGISITALHNHLLRAQPATFYMHVLGHGDAVKLATALHEGVALSKTPLVNTPPPAAGSPPPKIDLDTAMLDQTLGAKGQIAGGVYQANIRRAETIKDGGMEVPVAMGSAETINFQPTGGGKPGITGDFVLTAAEVNPVLRALREQALKNRGRASRSPPGRAWRSARRYRLCDQRRRFGRRDDRGVFPPDSHDPISYPFAMTRLAIRPRRGPLSPSSRAPRRAPYSCSAASRWNSGSGRIASLAHPALRRNVLKLTGGNHGEGHRKDVLHERH